jgi:aminoglycoside phosphotransferase family enzyme/predicted kinase
MEFRMDVRELIEGLSRPEAWPRPPARVELVQTHASLVFLGEDEVYKLKKPVDFGFLDYSTLDKRRLACEAEVSLNRRLAPEVYLGVVPVTAGPRLGGEGEALEWAVHMRRLPDDCTLRALLEQDACDDALLARLAKKLSRFFTAADGGADVARSASFEVIERHCLENFDHALRQEEVGLSARVLQRFRGLTVLELGARRELIERRAAAGRARDGHGDLRLDHCYEIDGELLIVDCIEFNDSLRHQDPVCDVAFLVMELESAGRADLAASFADAYFTASGDAEGRALLPLYVAYRQAVRGKVRSLEAADEGVAPEQREAAAIRAGKHFLQGLARLAPPSERPALVLVGGPPACGKSTLARGLCEQAGFERISSDETRKALAGLSPLEDGSSAPGEGIYTAEWTERTYQACFRLAVERLNDGGRVVVDASFGSDERRAPFLLAAQLLGASALWLDLELDAEEARRRLQDRGVDASDANAAVQEQLRSAHEPPGNATSAFHQGLPASGSPGQVLARALDLIRAMDST